MRFNHFLTSYLPAKAYGGQRLYREMVAQAVAADACGYDAVSIPEHHLVNILMVPSPLQMAVKVAACTSRVDIVTAVAVLPVRDMRILAGEAVQADMLCDGRLVLGVGRGAFAWEIGRLGVPMAETPARFQESLAVLQALLSGQPVSWDGAYYRFDPITVMPPPMRPLPLMVAVMEPSRIHEAAARGFDVQTTPLQASHEVLLAQVNAFHRGRAEAPPAARPARLSLQRVTYLARDQADVREKAALIYDYYRRFDNVFGGPGVVEDGMIVPLPRVQTLDELIANCLICTRDEMIDRIAAYAEAGIDEIIMTGSFGQPQAEMLDMIERFAGEVMPHFRTPASEPERLAVRA